MRKLFLALSLAAGICSLYGADELVSGVQILSKNGWKNFEEVVQYSEAGKLKTGSFDLDWPVLLSKFRTGRITARELWNQSNAMTCKPVKDSEYWSLWGSLARHIIMYGNDPELSQEVMTLLESNVKGNDPVKHQAAARGLAALYYNQGKFVEAWPYLCEPRSEAGFLLVVARKMLASNQIPPADIYAGLRTKLLFRDNTPPAVMLKVTLLMLDAATAAAIPDSEVRATLMQISRLYVSYTIGESESAKAWAEFIGAVEETAKRYQ
ncbi:MAG: hypothetical protein HPZ91_07270 [Lentisphaeria bacterium]|nr:hypothetical protein [Lentisphaeria bacterium]